MGIDWALLFVGLTAGAFQSKFSLVIASDSSVIMSGWRMAESYVQQN